MGEGFCHNVECGARGLSGYVAAKPPPTAGGSQADDVRLAADWRPRKENQEAGEVERADRTVRLGLGPTARWPARFEDKRMDPGQRASPPASQGFRKSY